MRAFVTGATGFLGRFLCQTLQEQGIDVTGVGSSACDLRDPTSLARYTDPFDRIYHLAAWTQAGDFCLRHPGEQWLINQAIHTHVLQWWATQQPQAKLITIGTSCAYDPDLPLEESYYFQGQPIESLFTYGMTKRMLLAGCLALHKQYGMEFLYVVPSTLYGPKYHQDGRQLHFIFDLIRKITQGAERNAPVVLWGDGHQKRELIHVRDFIRILLALQDHPSDIYNIGGGQEYSIREFAHHICEVIGYDRECIQYDTTRYVGARSKFLSIRKIQELGLSPTIPLIEGLKETISWCQASMNWGLQSAEEALSTGA